MPSNTSILTLAVIAANPEIATWPIALPSGETGVFRPLLPGDAPRLAQFLEGLSAETRRFSTFDSYDLAQAEEFCKAIYRYDKLRFVAVAVGDIIALFEFSFAITDGDKTAWRMFGIALNEATDVRFGPTIADARQNRGLGSLLFPHMTDIARRFGKQRIILWGGVYGDNHRAIHYYHMRGFRMIGSRTDDQGREILDGILTLE